MDVMVSKGQHKLPDGRIWWQDKACHGLTHKNNTSVAFISGAVAVLRLLGSDIEIFSWRSAVMIFVVLGREFGGWCPAGSDLDAILALLGNFGIDKGLLGQGKTLAFSLGLLNDILLAQRSLSAA